MRRKRSIHILGFFSGPAQSSISHKLLQVHSIFSNYPLPPNSIWGTWASFSTCRLKTERDVDCWWHVNVLFESLYFILFPLFSPPRSSQLLSIISTPPFTPSLSLFLIHNHLNSFYECTSNDHTSRMPSPSLISSCTTSSNLLIPLHYHP